MLNKLTALAAALIFGLTSFAPVAAEARDGRRHGYYDDDRHGRYDHRRRHYRDDDDGDEAAAAVVGLIVGLALGSIASQDRGRRVESRCTDNYQRCAPPQQSYDPYYDRQAYAPPQQPYYDDRQLEGGPSAYEREYGYVPSNSGQAEQCTRRERQWDRYANRYLTVDVPC